MIKLLLAVALALAGTGCTALSEIPPSPSAVADTTAADEQAALAVELAYKGARMAAELAVDAGVLEGEAAARVAALDRTAYRAVLVTRAAYETGNADSYAAAARDARSAVAAMLAAIRG